MKRIDVRAIVNATFDKALDVQRPAAMKNVARLRRLHPEKSPAELISYVNRFYLASVTATGMGSGAAAIVPNVVVQVPVALADLASFLEASVFYTLTLAEIYDVDLEDTERRRMLVTAVLVGNSVASTTLEPLLGKTVPYWGKKVVESIPMKAIDAANKVLGPRFITKYGTIQGTLVLAKQVPFAIGVVVGGSGNHLFGRFVVKGAKKILGPAPTTWPDRREAQG